MVKVSRAIALILLTISVPGFSQESGDRGAVVRGPKLERVRDTVRELELAFRSGAEDATEATGDINLGGVCAFDPVYSIVSDLYARAETKDAGSGTRFLAKLHRDVWRRSPEVSKAPIFKPLFDVSTADIRRRISFAETARVSLESPEALIRKLSDVFAQSGNETVLRLSQLGFDKEVQHMRRIDGVNIDGSLSARAYITRLVQRAEMANPGTGGDQVLKILFDDRSKVSAALREDPAFAKYKAAPAVKLVAPIELSSASEVKLKLPPSSEAAIQKLAEVYSGKQIASMRATLVRNLNNTAFNERVFEQIVTESGTSREVIRKAIDAGTPPPSPEKALEGIIKDTGVKRAAFIEDPHVRTIVQEMSKTLPDGYKDTRAKELNLMSKKRQAIEVLAQDSTGRGRWGNPSGDVGPATPPGPRPTKPDVIGNDPERAARAQRRNARRTGRQGTRYRNYTSKAFKVVKSRSFRTGIGSARLGRGISVGSKVESRVRLGSANAYWHLNEQDPKYGQIFVELQGDGKIEVAASRPIVADSFRCSVELLETENEELVLREGELLILMSMDPSADWVSRFRQRGVVLHPSIHGSELAWSMVRVDFWLADMPKLLAEAQPFSRMPRQLSKFEDLQIRASTWQYYEQNHEVLVSEVDGKRTLSVASSWREDGNGAVAKRPPRSHLGIAMFTSTKNDETEAILGEDQFYRLPKHEMEVQPLLDELAITHPDFVRLNDLIESLAILRWLGGQKSTLYLIETHDAPAELPTPNSYEVGIGRTAK